MTHHPILANHPDYIAHEEEAEKLDEAENSWRERTRTARADYEERLADHRAAKAEALLAGDPPPPEPAPPADGGPDEARLFADQRSALRARRRDLLADLASEIETEARNREEEIAAEARPHIEALQRLADESAELVATVRTVKLPAERRDGVPAQHGVADRMRQGVVDIADLVASVVDGLSLLEPVEPEPPRMIAATFEPPEEPSPSQPSTTRDRTPAAIQRKG